MNNKKVEHSLWEEPKLECISLSAADVIITSDCTSEKEPPIDHQDDSTSSSATQS